MNRPRPNPTIARKCGQTFRLTLSDLSDSTVGGSESRGNAWGNRCRALGDSLAIRLRVVGSQVRCMTIGGGQ